jgi:hypothetical protein
LIPTIEHLYPSADRPTRGSSFVEAVNNREEMHMGEGRTEYKSFVHSISITDNADSSRGLENFGAKAEKCACGEFGLGTFVDRAVGDLRSL